MTACQTDMGMDNTLGAVRHKFDLIRKCLPLFCHLGVEPNKTMKEYRGSWKNDNPDGNGEWTGCEGDRYVGSFYLWQVWRLRSLRVVRWPSLWRRVQGWQKTWQKSKVQIEIRQSLHWPMGERSTERISYVHVRKWSNWQSTASE